MSKSQSQHEPADREISCLQKQVRFSTVSVRKYDLTCIGLVNRGPGIGLDWFYGDEQTMRIEVHEFVRPRRISQRHLIMRPAERTKLLVESHGFKIEDLRRSCSKIRYGGRLSHLSGGKSSIRPTPYEPHADLSFQVSNPMRQGLISISPGKTLVNAMNMLSKVTL
jgi:hypothetical protein